MEEICWSKLSSESVKITSKVSFVLVLIEVLPIDISVGVLEFKSKWHFPGMALRWLYGNQWKSLLEMSLAQDYGVVSSA